MPYIRSTCRAGKTKEIAKYYTRRFHPKGEQRAEKKNLTTEQQQKVNDRQLVRKLTRILNANFDSNCWYITFSYTKEHRPDGAEQLKNQKRELLKRLRKVFKAEGSELKYVETAEIGERGATHIHMVINAIDIRKIKAIWSYGYVTVKPLEESGQYRKLAEYFIKYHQKTRKTDKQIQKKAYNCSRNLERPEPEKKVMRGNRFKKGINVPKGWYLDKESVREGTTAEGYEFLYYTLIEEVANVRQQNNKADRIDKKELRRRNR